MHIVTDNKSTPLLSIITVSYNSSKTIRQTIESVLKQKSNWIEYIIIDGGSVDDTKHIIQDYSENIDFWITEPDKGIYDAMNKGINFSKGEYISFLNSDDYLKPLFSEIIYPYLKLGQSPIYSFGITLINKKGNLYDWMPELVSHNHFNPQNMYFPHPGTITKREVFTMIGQFKTIYKSGSDLDWVCRCIKAGIQITTICESILFFRTNGQSNSLISYKETRDIAIAYDKPKVLAYYSYFKQVIKHYISY